MLPKDILIGLNGAYNSMALERVITFCPRILVRSNELVSLPFRESLTGKLLIHSLDVAETEI